MRSFLLILILTVLNSSVFANDDPIKDNTNSLVIGMKTNSVEGFGKFGILKADGDTLFAVSYSSDVMPGMYLITASNKNQVYHKKLYVIDPAIAKALGLKPAVELLAMVVGVVDFEEYGKLNVQTADPLYHYASDPSKNFDPGTYLIVGSSNQDLYHQKLVISGE